MKSDQSEQKQPTRLRPTVASTTAVTAPARPHWTPEAWALLLALNEERTQRVRPGDISEAAE
jgi:hypothetical protein